MFNSLPCCTSLTAIPQRNPRLLHPEDACFLPPRKLQRCGEEITEDVAQFFFNTTKKEITEAKEPNAKLLRAEKSCKLKRGRSCDSLYKLLIAKRGVMKELETSFQLSRSATQSSPRSVTNSQKKRSII